MPGFLAALPELFNALLKKHYVTARAARRLISDAATQIQVMREGSEEAIRSYSCCCCCLCSYRRGRD